MRRERARLHGANPVGRPASWPPRWLQLRGVQLGRRVEIAVDAGPRREDHRGLHWVGGVCSQN